MIVTERIRDVIRYIKKFKGSTIVVRIDDDVLESPLFGSHIHDLSLLYETGIRIVIVPGAQNHISRVLDAYRIEWTMIEGIRVTSEEGMNFIKMAAFDTSNRIMTSLSGERLSAVIGNWVRARGRGVINGTDFGSAGIVEKVNLEALLSALDDGFIPIIPCVGWTAIGKPYNISSTELAVATAVALKAEKLFFMGCGQTISIDDYTMPPNAALSPEGRMAAIAVDDIEQFIQLNRQVEKPHCPLHELTDLLVQSKNACSKGVTRAHILDADIDGVLPAEIFSDLGSGTMIYKNNYGTFRTMVREDIPAVLSLMHPFVEQGILLQRTSSDLESTTADFIVYEIDGGIRACAALHTYPDPAGNATESAGNATESVGNAAGSAGNTTGSAGATTSPIGEIAGLAVDESYAHMGIGPKLMELLIQKGKSSGMKILFVLTTRTADWFERFGFKPADISILPEKRREKWSQSRASRVLVLSLTH